eukprot:SAG11_NODE_581_length_8363_cov_13.931873_3_plen_70_part_00
MRITEWRGREGAPTPPRKICSPPTETQSSDAPWNESHIEIVLCRPVAYLREPTRKSTPHPPPDVSLHSE